MFANASHSHCRGRLQTEWGVMFVSHGRQTLPCLAVLLSFFISKPYNLIAQTIATAPSSVEVAATEAQTPREVSAETFLLAGDVSSSIVQSETGQNSTEPSKASSGNFFQRLTEYY